MQLLQLQLRVGHDKARAVALGAGRAAPHPAGGSTAGAAAALGQAAAKAATGAAAPVPPRHADDEAEQDAADHARPHDCVQRRRREVVVDADDGVGDAADARAAACRAGRLWERVRPPHQVLDHVIRAEVIRVAVRGRGLARRHRGRRGPREAPGRVARHRHVAHDLQLVLRLPRLRHARQLNGRRRDAKDGGGVGGDQRAQDVGGRAVDAGVPGRQRLDRVQRSRQRQPKPHHDKQPPAGPRHREFLLAVTLLEALAQQLRRAARCAVREVGRAVRADAAPLRTG
mmetsp:Transcript_19586/g.58065  ORF Transcript_19586/g.58065 Transcript_19586/m.58065 type:complete len:286 (+) Transcript_19586:1601-2458(+)